MKRATTSLALALAVSLAGLTFTGCERSEDTAAVDPQLDGVLPKTAPDTSIFEDQVKIYAKITPAPPPPPVPATTPATTPATEPGDTPAPEAAPVAPPAPAAPAGDATPPPPPPN